jgi:hypothetical protein
MTAAAGAAAETVHVGCVVAVPVRALLTAGIWNGRRTGSRTCHPAAAAAAGTVDMPIYVGP